MLERSEADGLLDAMRTARLAGDVEGALRLFDDDAAFAVVGIGNEARGKDAIRAALDGLFGEYEFLEWEPVKTVVDGDDIAVRHRLKVRHRPSGAVLETETSEFLSVKGGRVLAFRQYADTARIAALTASGYRA